MRTTPILIAATFASVAIAASAQTAPQGAPAGAWSFTEDGAGGIARVGTGEGGAAALSLSCRAGSSDVIVSAMAASVAGSAGDPVEIRFEVDRDTFRREAVIAEGQAGGAAPSATIEQGDVLLAALSTGKTLVLAIGEARTPLSLKGSAAALRSLRAACRSPSPTAQPPAGQPLAGTGAPATAASPAVAPSVPTDAPAGSGAVPPVLGITPIPPDMRGQTAPDQ